MPFPLGGGGRRPDAKGAFAISRPGKGGDSGKAAPSSVCSQTASPRGEAQIVEKLLGPLWEGGSARRRWGRELHAGTKVSGKGEALSLRPFGPPLPLWRKRHLPRIGGVCLPRGRFFDTQSFPKGGSL